MLPLRDALFGRAFTSSAASGATNVLVRRQHVRQQNSSNHAALKARTGGRMRCLPAAKSARVKPPRSRLLPPRRRQQRLPPTSAFTPAAEPRVFPQRHLRPRTPTPARRRTNSHRHAVSSPRRGENIPKTRAHLPNRQRHQRTRLLCPRRKMARRVNARQKNIPENGRVFTKLPPPQPWSTPAGETRWQHASSLTPPSVNGYAGV